MARVASIPGLFGRKENSPGGKSGEGRPGKLIGGVRRGAFRMNVLSLPFKGMAGMGMGLVVGKTDKILGPQTPSPTRPLP
jgi:hypothetical protein